MPAFDRYVNLFFKIRITATMYKQGLHCLKVQNIYKYDIRYRAAETKHIMVEDEICREVGVIKSCFTSTIKCALHILTTMHFVLPQ